jgi:hypothetical protein
MSQFQERHEKVKKQEERTKRMARTMDAFVQGLDLAGGLPTSDLDVSLNSPESTKSDCSQDSPTTKMCKAVDRNYSNLWRTQRKVAKAMIKMVAYDQRLREEAGSASAWAAVVGDLRAQASLPAQNFVPLEFDVAAGTTSEEALSLVLPAQSKDAGSSKPPSPQPSIATQPEEEADGPLPAGGMSLPLPRKSKLLAAEEILANERVVVEGSRQSTMSDAEPAREPQPLESPRDIVAELSISLDTPYAESPPGGGSLSPNARPSASGPEHEEFVTTEAETSMNSSPSGDQSEHEDSYTDYGFIQPGEDGMERNTTMLYMLEQHELRRELHIIVPVGMNVDRKVTFHFEGKDHEIIVPDGYEEGQQVPVTLTNRPFLERTAGIAARRGHGGSEFPERWSVIDSLRHSLRTDQNHSRLDTPEFRQRYQCYHLLRGRSATPLLSNIAEDGTFP